MTSSDTVVVVGAGIAGIACARRMDAAGLPVVVLERGGRAGGRMASRTLHGRAVDLGAQYVTASDPGFQAVVDDWAARGLARAWTDSFHTGDGRTLGPPKPGPTRWAAPEGMRALVEDLATGLDVRTGHPVSAVRTGSDGPGIDGEPVRAVALAMPDAQAARVLTREDPALAGSLDHTWSPALALAAGWSTRGWDVDGVFVDGADTALTWIADDGRRRGDDAPVLVAHSTPELAAAHTDQPETACRRCSRGSPGSSGSARRRSGRPYVAGDSRSRRPRATRRTGCSTRPAPSGSAATAGRRRRKSRPRGCRATPSGPRWSTG